LSVDAATTARPNGEFCSRAPVSLSCLSSLSLFALGTLTTACQQSPAPAPASTTTVVPTQAPSSTPSSTTESTSKTQSTEVKPADPSNPDSASQKTTTSDSTTVKQKQ
jgi:hypothetical protein